MHCPVRYALLKIREESPQWDMDRVLIDVPKVIDNTLGAGGFSPNQAVFEPGISDLGSSLLGEGRHRQNVDVLQDLSTHGPIHSGSSPA